MTKIIISSLLFSAVDDEMCGLPLLSIRSTGYGCQNRISGADSRVRNLLPGGGVG
jgi:hypothetical protein